MAPVIAGLADKDGNVATAVSLVPEVSDDALPAIPGLVTYEWSQVSGPAAGTFGDATSAVTTFTAATPGSYVLRLQADDGETKVAAELTVNMLAPPSSTYASWISGFPTLTGNDALPGADPEGDGVPNLIEDALNMNPITASITGLPQVGRETENEIEYITLTYAKDLSKTDLAYQVEKSAGLQSWSDLSDALISTASSVETRKVRVPLNGADRFMRLKIKF